MILWMIRYYKYLFQLTQITPSSNIDSSSVRAVEYIGNLGNDSSRQQDFFLGNRTLEKLMQICLRLVNILRESGSKIPCAPTCELGLNFIEIFLYFLVDRRVQLCKTYPAQSYVLPLSLLCHQHLCQFDKMVFIMCRCDS